jgi:Aminoglycoside-2''-adenylyltransferase
MATGTYLKAAGQARSRASEMRSQKMTQRDGASQGVDLGEVLGVLADLTGAGCSVWVAGGWGVDALVGRQTRLHRDLDLALDARNETVALRALERRGYRVESDWRPVRVELVLRGACPDQQLLFHTGYEPRAMDLLDLAPLEGLPSRG